MESIEGKITALSHIFYITPKSLFLELSSNDGRWNVMITDRNHMKEWREQLAMRQWVRITQLKRVTLPQAPDAKVSVFVTTSDSTLMTIPKGVARNPPTNHLINYEGLVTDDTFGPSGFYLLDEKLILCLSYAKLVTSLPIVRKGDRIVLHDSHRIRFGEDIVIFICGRGNLVNKSSHKENEALFPKPDKEDGKDFIQHFALETNCSMGHLLSLHRLSQLLSSKLSAHPVQLPRESVTRKLSGSQKGLLAVLADHFGTIMPMEPIRTRSFSREFLGSNNGGSCSCPPSAKEPFWNVELWPLDAREMERRCSSRNLWTQVGSPAAGTGTGTAGNRYWEHEVAIIESRSDLISLLVGLLSFRRGRWELLDNAGSVEVVASEGDCLQFRDRVVFATSFSVHREAFTPADCGGSSTYQRVYLGIDDFQPATMPLARPEQEKREESCPDEGEGSVRFLALDKSMPLSLYVNQPAIRRIFGYLVLASLHSDVPEGSGTKLTKRHCSWTGSRSSSSQAERANNPEGPAKCLLFFAHDHPSLGYPELIEGRVYVIRLSRRKLLTNPISLASLKDVPALNDDVFIVPDHASVHRVAYTLPKAASFIRHDVLSAADCFSLADEAAGTVVSLRGRIVDRMHMDPLFASERGGGHAFTTHQGTWLGIPGNKKIVLKIGEDGCDFSFGSRMDVYLSLADGQVYPLGLLRGAEVELTLLCLRKTQTSGRIYCTSTALTSVRILRIRRHFAPDLRPRLDMIREACRGRYFLSQIESVRPKEVFRSLVTVRYIHKLSVAAVCSGCHSPVLRGVCTYPGCHSRTGYKVELKAWCTVEDGTGTATMFISGEACRQWLKLPGGVWRVLEEQVLPHEGEFLYFSSSSGKGTRMTSLAGRILSLYCEASAHLRRPLHITADRFMNNFSQGTSTAYFLKDHPSRRLFCLHVADMDPASCAAELLSGKGGGG